MTDTTAHEYFTVSRTNAKPHKKNGKIAVHFSDAPKRDSEKGTTSYSMIWPGLLVAEHMANPEDFAKEVAEILNENAHRFFDSAKPAQSGTRDLLVENERLRCVEAAARDLAKAFGAPGDWGYNSREGKALFGLHRAMAKCAERGTGQ